MVVKKFLGATCQDLHVISHFNVKRFSGRHVVGITKMINVRLEQILKEIF